jgi:hypothetical protein
VTGQRFASWYCARCDCGSGSVLLTDQDEEHEGAKVRADGTQHLRYCPGNQVDFTTGTVETIRHTPEQRLAGAIFGTDPAQVRDRPKLRAVDDDRHRRP